MGKIIDYPLELNGLRDRGLNMASYVPLFYNIARNFRNGQKGIRTIVEIGTRGGISTNAFLYGLRDRGNNPKKTKLYSIDISDCSGVVKDETLMPYWDFIQNDSKTFEWKGEISVLFIDGDHSYDGCLADYKKYEPFVVNGGLILFHDVSWIHKSPIKVFWDEVKYPKSVLPLTKSGLGVVYKVKEPYYDNELVNLDSLK